LQLKEGVAEKRLGILKVYVSNILQALSNLSFFVKTSTIADYFVEKDFHGIRNEDLDNMRELETEGNVG